MKNLYCLVLALFLAFVAKSQIITSFPYYETCSDSAKFADWGVDASTLWYHDTTDGVIRATDHVGATYSNLYSPWFITTGVSNLVCNFMLMITPDSVTGCVPELQVNSNDTVNGEYLVEAISAGNYAHCAPTTDNFILGGVWTPVSIPLSTYSYIQYVFTANFLGNGDIQIKDIWIGDANQFPTAVTEVQPISFSVYPNPSHGIFTVNLKGVNNEPVRVEIYNATGQRIENAQCEFATSGSTQVNLGNAIPGSYFIHIYSGTASAVRKVEIQ